MESTTINKKIPSKEPYVPLSDDHCAQISCGGLTCVLAMQAYNAETLKIIYKTFFLYDKKLALNRAKLLFRSKREAVKPELPVNTAGSVCPHEQAPVRYRLSSKDQK